MVDSTLPSIAGPFALKRQIATGASSTVFSAENIESGATVALKLFHSQLVHDKAFSERLKREAEALQMLKHPNIVQLIRPWAFQNQFFLELEMVEGLTLKTWSEQNPPEWIEPHLWILAQVARALGAVHEQQILHRDLKPENILISPEGVAKLTDFGLARSEFFRQQLTQTGSLVGSLAYMAPETIEGQTATFASDIFSFGIVAYEILCGHHPFTDGTGQIQVKELLAGKFTACTSRNPRIPQGIAQLVESCLRKDESARPTSIWLVEAALMDYLQSSGQLMQAKEWMKTGDPQIFSSSLSLKNRKLKLEIESALAAGLSRSLVLAKVNEFHALFPNDPALATMMAAIAGQPAAAPRPQRLGLLLPALLLGAVALGYLTLKAPNTNRAVPSVAPPSVSPSPAAVSAPVPEVAKPAVAPKPAAIAKPVSNIGRLRLMIDKGVSAFIDGRRIASSELMDYRIKPGRYTLLLEKDGFLPIEKTVNIRPGKITIVNARTEEP